MITSSACASGCSVCATSTGTCSACQPNLQPSRDNPQTCIPQQFLPSGSSAFTQCPSGTFLSNPADQTCSPCNAVCSDCFGAEANQCLSCSSGRGLLEDTCVSVDSGTGICDGSAFDSANAVAWILNSATSVCDRESTAFALSLRLVWLIGCQYSSSTGMYSW